MYSHGSNNSAGFMTLFNPHFKTLYLNHIVRVKACG